ncbi:MAG: hypothetical protein DWQ35_13980 [Planctomycetota bacterium]|nr:MAG: hypothetical protein DWQ35_13980 [Planctomycetota bacterium]REK25947.1 MAG: hypothetical protein DWQ42_09975 [Planctomycetota bacterium]REK46937.1 MAG: hypothetical protein DWQ46_05425 [Planctomycetota bacterium]
MTNLGPRALEQQRQSLGTAFPQGNAGALCCSAVPFGQGVEDGLGFRRSLFWGVPAMCQMGPIDFRRLRRSIILLADAEGKRWCTLSIGPNTWAVRTYTSHEVSRVAYQPQLRDYRGAFQILVQLSLAEVGEICGEAVAGIRFDDAASWYRILEHVEQEYGAVADGGDGPDEGPAQIPLTPMRHVYDQFKLYTSLACHLEMAGEIDRVPTRLEALFEASVNRFNSYMNSEAFFPQIPPRKDLPDPTTVTKIGTTRDLVSLTRAAGNCSVTNDPTLQFRYVDREIVPARTTGGVQYDNGDPATSGRRLDMLLTDTTARTPILAEVKVGNDKNPFFALMQLLMYAAEFATPHQYERLREHYPEQFCPASVEYEIGEETNGVPLMDLYIVLSAYNFRSPVRADLLEMTDSICSRLVELPGIGRHIRRFTCLEAKQPNVGGLEFEKLFCHSTIELE